MNNRKKKLEEMRKQLIQSLNIQGKKEEDEPKLSNEEIERRKELEKENIYYLYK